jgi:predicted flap endonuclease-1-like 5' DNA nuclease
MIPQLARRLGPFGAALVLVSSSAAYASNYALEEIPQSIPASDAAKLKAAGIGTTFTLLEKAGEAKDRKLLAKQTKIAEKTLESWAQMADLLRVKGIGPDVAKLLSAAGIKTVAELKTANPSKLNDDISKANGKLHLSENPPSLEHLAAWIAQAQTLPIVLH